MKKKLFLGKIRTIGFYKSAVLNRIDQQMYYSGVDDIFEIAAWFGIAISKGHAFVDGNKRTGLAVMLTYLEIQGITILEQTGLDDLMVDIVESQESHDTLSKLVAEFLYDLSVI